MKIAKVIMAGLLTTMMVVVSGEELAIVSNPDYVKNVYVAKSKTDITKLFTKYGETGYKYRFKIEEKAQRKIATVTRKGVFKAKKTGTVNVTLYRKKKGEKWAKIEEQKVGSEKPDIPKKITTLKVGDTVDATSFIKTEMRNKPTSYESSKTAVAAIDSSTGKIKVLKSGSTKITMIYGSGKGSAKYKVKIIVK